MEKIKIFDFKRDGELLDNLTLVTQVGLTMVGAILLFFFIGYYLDKWLGTKGLFISIFILLGVIGGGYTVYRQIMQVTSKNSGEGKEDERSGQ